MAGEQEGGKEVRLESTEGSFRIQLTETKERLLEGAFDRRGCDFKVLVSPGVHPFIRGDSQSCDLSEGNVKVG